MSVGCRSSASIFAASDEVGLVRTAMARVAAVAAVSGEFTATPRYFAVASPIPTPKVTATSQALKAVEGAASPRRATSNPGRSRPNRHGRCAATATTSTTSRSTWT